MGEQSVWPQELVVRTSRDVQGGEQIFVELDPHQVAGVAVGGIHPGALSGLHLAQR